MMSNSMPAKYFVVFRELITCMQIMSRLSIKKRELVGLQQTVQNVLINFYAIFPRRFHSMMIHLLPMETLS